MRWLVLLLVGCAASTAPGRLRYVNQDPITAVNDRVPLDTPPGAYTEGLVEYYFAQEFTEPARYLLTIGESKPAKNANSLGNVPDSAWFTNRTVTPEDVRRGPGQGGPDPSQPWRVVGVKIGGMAIGITIVDGRGDKYVLKFDEKNFPETESAADVIVQRLTWAMGYNVPENHVVSFKRDQLVLDDSAEYAARSGPKRKMTPADLDRYLAMAQSEGDTYRGLTSKIVDGKALGGIEPVGVRASDPNDRVPHELRRDLRGQRVLWAWVNHIDIKSQNSLVVLTKDNFLEWYALDFGESLGVAARTTSVPRLGYRGTYAWGSALLSFVTFGTYVHPWERTARHPGYRGLGEFEAAHFDPGDWSANHRWRPVDIADRFDEFWAAEIMLRLTPAHVRAAVDAGAYTDKRTTAYMVETLLARQRKLGRWALGRVAPITNVSATDATLCFDDLWLRHDFGLPSTTRYALVTYDYAGKRIGATAMVATGARACLPMRPGIERDAYTIARVEVRRNGRALPVAFVHLAKGPKGMRVVGIDRR